MKQVVNLIFVVIIIVALVNLIIPDPGIGPGPKPGPDPKPVVAGQHICIVEETKENRKWPYNDIKLDQFAMENCAKVNGVPEMHVLDVDQDVTHLSSDWQIIMQDAKKHRDELPWLYVWGVKKFVSQPLPDSADATLKVLEAHKR